MLNQSEQKPYLRSAENTISLYEAAEIVFEQLKNSPEKWDAITTLCEGNQWLVIGPTDAEITYDYKYFTNWFLREALGSMHYQTVDSKLAEKFYFEIAQEFGIQLEGDVTPFLTRLGMLVRKEVVGKKLYTIGVEWNALYKNQMENLPKNYKELDISIAKLSPLSKEVEELDTILKAIDAKMALPKFQS